MGSDEEASREPCPLERFMDGLDDLRGLLDNDELEHGVASTNNARCDLYELVARVLDDVAEDIADDVDGQQVRADLRRAAQEWRN